MANTQNLIAPPSLLIGKVWVPVGCDALLYVSYTLQSALESGQEARTVLIDFQAAFNWVNLQGIVYQLRTVGIGGCVFYTDNQSRQVMVDGCRSKLVNIVSGMPHGFVPIIVSRIYLGARTLYR